MRRLTVVVAGLMLVAACVPNDPDGDGADIVTTTAALSGITTTTTPSANTTTESLVGTRQDPLEPGTTVRVGDWEVTYLGAVLDATEVVMAENPFNSPPIEGRQFVLLQFEGTYVGDDSGIWLVNVRVSVLGSANNTFGGSLDDYCGVIPDDIDDMNETFPSGQVTGNECVSVPSDQLEGALVFIEVALTFGDDDRTFYRMVP